MARAEDLERFMRKVERDPATGCLLWGKLTFRNGYGRFGVGKRSWLAHRWIFVHDHGYLPPVVMHACDNSSCVELMHLIPGTHADNMADMTAKGRKPRGEASATSKLTDVEVSEIREEYANGILTCRLLAEVYGVGKSQIHNIVTQK